MPKHDFNIRDAANTGFHSVVGDKDGKTLKFMIAIREGDADAYRELLLKLAGGMLVPDRKNDRIKGDGHEKIQTLAFTVASGQTQTLALETVLTGLESGAHNIQSPYDNREKAVFISPHEIASALKTFSGNSQAHSSSF